MQQKKPQVPSSLCGIILYLFPFLFIISVVIVSSDIKLWELQPALNWIQILESFTRSLQ